MILTLFVVLLSLSLSLIVLGILKPDESGLALVGFLVMFLLSMQILGGSLQYEKGINSTSLYTYDANGSITSTSQTLIYDYANFSDSNSHTIGYYLAVISIVGFVGVMLGLRSAWKRESEIKRKKWENE
jgi:hypothetical protein